MVKQKKTILGILLCALLTVCVVMGLVNLNSNNTAYALELPADATDWLVDEGDDHVWYKVSDLGDNNYGLTIGGEGAMPDFDNADDRPYDNLTDDINSITSLTIQEGVTVLSRDAFYNLKIKTVTIPASVKELHDSCFMHCEDLEEIIFAEGSNLEKISGNDAVFGHNAITSFTFPASVKCIESPALFMGCVNLEEITFLSTPETISEYAFYPLGYDMESILDKKEYDKLSPEEQAKYFEPIPGAGHMKKLNTFVILNLPENWTKETIGEDGTLYCGLFSDGSKIISNIAKVLNTNPDFPKTQSTVWKSENGGICYLYNNESLIISNVFSQAVDITNSVSPLNDNYIYSCSNGWVATFNMEDGKVTSITIEVMVDNFNYLKGTYKPEEKPLPKTTANDGLSTGAIIGIVIGAVALVGIIAFVVVKVSKKKKKND